MRIGTFILALLLVSGHTAGLQLVAWSGMFIDRMSTAPTVMQALISTVDGTRPCALCRAVVDLQDHDQPTGVLKTAKKPESIPVRWLCPPASVTFFQILDQFGKRCFADDDVLDVELPPPRGA